MSSLDDTLACAACGGGSGGNEGELSSSTKKCTSCEQKDSAEHCKDGASDSTSGNYRIDAVSDILGRLDISNNDDDDKLFADPPPKEDCEICMLPMPHATYACGEVQRIYQPCCGKHFCGGCVMAMEEEMDKGTMKRKCAFCRVRIASSKKEFVTRLKDRMRLYDAGAFYMLGQAYRYGDNGVSKDTKKALELWKQAAQFGSIIAQFRVGLAYDEGEGDEKDMTKAKHHYTLAAIGGHETARDYLGVIEAKHGNMDRAMKHYMIAAKAGFDKSLKEVGEGFKDGCVTKDDYANTLRAYQITVNDMKSVQRTTVKNNRD